MDGAELLNRVRELYPDTVRIILSGQSNQESIQRSIGSTHQYLSKPCDAATLKKTLTRACALRKRLSNESLKQIVSRITTLPSLPANYHDLMDELRSPEASIQRVAELISRDVAMTTKLLQLVNSSYFGLPQPIESPAHAASLLGLNLLRPLALSVGIFTQFDGPAAETYSLDRLIRHSTAVGDAAHRIAEDFAPRDKQLQDAALLAGLIHDVGQIILAANQAELYRVVLQTATEQRIPLYQAEIRHFGTDHANVGAYLLSLWGLPDDVIEATAYHHQPGFCSTEGLTSLTAVYIANLLDNESRLPPDGIVHDGALDEAYLLRVGAEPQLERWRELCGAAAQRTL
jgi:HD-like signal output (HDOD) protein